MKTKKLFSVEASRASLVKSHHTHLLFKLWQTLFHMFIVAEGLVHTQLLCRSRALLFGFRSDLFVNPDFRSPGTLLISPPTYLPSRGSSGLSLEASVLLGSLLLITAEVRCLSGFPLLFPSRKLLASRVWSSHRPLRLLASRESLEASHMSGLFSCPEVSDLSGIRSQHSRSQSRTSLRNLLKLVCLFCLGLFLLV